MRSNYLAYALLLAAATGCEKDDPLFCKMNPGASGCPRMDADVIIGEDADAEAPGLDARVCFGGTGTFAVCLAAPPTAPLNLGAGTIDTTTTAGAGCLTVQPENWMTNMNPDACFLVGTSISIDGAISVQGVRPLVLLSTTTLAVNANIDGASHRGGKTGPGAPAASPLCLNYTVSPTNGGNGGGGGAGGSFMKAGAAGGTGDNGTGTSGGSTGVLATMPAALRAGCNGQPGAGSNASTVGRGGGAIYLIAGDSITIASGITIDVSGCGATKPGKDDGGSGGGSGGMLLLQAPLITATGATFIANGGGGSSGATDTGSGSAADGNDPASVTAGGTGGPAPTCAGSGGNGWADPDTQAAFGNPALVNCGGGGGGGGGGWIQASVATGATSSPPVFVP